MVRSEIKVDELGVSYRFKVRQDVNEFNQGQNLTSSSLPVRSNINKEIKVSARDQEKVSICQF